jgi:heat shock protein HtpX
MNMMRTAILLAAMTALFVLVGAALGGRGGMVIALLVAVGTNLFAYWNSDRLALSAVGAQEVDAASAPDLVRLVGELAARADLPMPRVYVVDSAQPNAFATGRDPAHAAVAVNTGLLNILSRAELAGVIAHELAHVKNRDTLTMTITATLAGAISSIAHWGLFFGGGDRRNGVIGSIAIAILAPLAAMVVQMAVSRGREYEADRLGGLICGNPLDLAGALVKLHQGAAAIPDAAVEAHPAMAHLFIVNPLTGGTIDNLFSTHPSMENRIAALEQQAAAMGVATDAGSRPQSPAGGAWSPFRDSATGGGPGSFLGGRGIGGPPAGGGRWRNAAGRDNPDSRRPRGPWG